MGKFLENFSFSRCTTPEFHVTAIRISEIVKNSLGSTPDPFIVRQLEGIDAEANKLEDSMKNTNRSPLTAELAVKHDRRKKALRGLTKLLRGMSAVDLDPAKRNLALSLLAIILKQGSNLIYKSHLKLSSALKVILEEFQSEVAKKCIADLGIGDLVAELDAAQNDFEKTYQEKVALDAQQTFPVKLPARSDLGYRLNSLLNYIDTNEADKQGNNEQLIKELNEVISYVMAKTKARRTRRENDQEEPPAATPASAV